MSETNSQTSGLWPVALFTLAYLVGAVIAAWDLRNQEFMIYIGVMFALIVMVGLVHRTTQLTIPVLWALSIWGIAHMAGGLVPVPDHWPIDGDIHVLYSLWLIPRRLKYDQLVHAYGFFVTTCVCWQVLRAAIARRVGQPRDQVAPSPALLVIAAAAGMGFGAMNEVIEFAATLLVPETNVGGYVNTGWDLVSNMVGSVGAALSIWFLSRRRGALVERRL